MVWSPGENEVMSGKCEECSVVIFEREGGREVEDQGVHGRIKCIDKNNDRLLS